MNKLIAAICALTLLTVIFSTFSEEYRIKKFQYTLDSIAQGYFERYERAGASFTDKVDHIHTQLGDLETISGDLIRSTNQAQKLAQDMSNATLLTAWNLLAMKTPGDLGKSAALDFVLSRKDSISGLDLSCPRLVDAACPAPIVLKDLTLKRFPGYSVNFDHIRLENLTFDGGRFDNSRLNHATLYVTLRSTKMSDVQARSTSWRHWAATQSTLEHVDFTDAHFAGGSFLGSNFYSVTFDNALVEYVNFDDARLFNTSFVGAGLSGSSFDKVIEMQDMDFTDAWAWHDQMPKGLDPSLITVCQFVDTHWGSAAFRGKPRPDDC